VWTSGDILPTDTKEESEELLAQVRKTHQASSEASGNRWTVTVGPEKTYHMDFLTAEEIIEMNRRLVKDTGEPHAVMFAGNLDYIIFQHQRDRGPMNPFFRGAALLHGIATTHVFVEGNKRTAMMACDTFLRDCGYEIEVRWEEFVGFALKVSRESTPLQEVYEWVVTHSRRIM
jgi:death-on-curing protein